MNSFCMPGILFGSFCTLQLFIGCTHQLTAQLYQDYGYAKSLGPHGYGQQPLMAHGGCKAILNLEISNFFFSFVALCCITITGLLL